MRDGVNMIKSVTNKIGSYFSADLNLSEIDEVKLKYSLEIILTDLSKFIILLLFFSLIGKPTFFILTFPFLSLLRLFTGGLHFKTYFGCLSFSFAFFLIIFFCSIYIHLDDIDIVLILLFSLITIYTVAPIPSKSRPKYNSKKLLKFKSLAILIVLLSVLIFYLTHKSPFLVSQIWVMLFGSIQLLISKEVTKDEDVKKTFQETHRITW